MVILGGIPGVTPTIKPMTEPSPILVPSGSNRSKSMTKGRPSAGFAGNVSAVRVVYSLSVGVVAPDAVGAFATASPPATATGVAANAALRDISLMMITLVFGGGCQLANRSVGAERRCLSPCNEFPHRDWRQ